MDAKSDVEKRFEKMRKKMASGSNFGALGRVLDGPGHVRGRSEGSQERSKTAPRAEQD